MAANHCRKASRSAPESRCRNADARSAIAASGGPGCVLRLPAEILIAPASTIMQTHQSFVLVLVILLFTEFRATIKAVHTPEIKSCFKRLRRCNLCAKPNHRNRDRAVAAMMHPAEK